MLIKAKSALYRNNSAYVMPFKMVMPIVIAQSMGLKDKDLHRIIEWTYNDSTKSLNLKLTDEKKEIRKVVKKVSAKNQ